MDEKRLHEILQLHSLWLIGDPNGVRADLSRANLREADLCGADLCGADLCGADLRGADLCVADLCGADLCGADLCVADLRGANLCGADLCEANLHEVDLCGADLCEANLREANLREANLRVADLRVADLCGADLRGANLFESHLEGAKNIDTVFYDEKTAFFALKCPEKGRYIGFKKAGGYIVELEIPADAKRSSATSNKCRASKAKVISITDKDGNPAGSSVKSDYDSSFIYTVGKVVEVQDFCTDRWDECAPGIHHFITRNEAVNYGI